jgi:NADH dehydrogenase (ubiquinone) Fe-S protein 6
MSTLLPTLRARLAQTSRLSARRISTTTRLLNQGPGTGENFSQANDPQPKKETPNVSKTNELEVSAMGNHDAPLVESAEVAEEARVMQAPNRAGIWSRSQMPREMAMTGPRFEQTIISDQVSNI